MSRLMKELINDAGELVFGKKHRDETIESIARNDPEYLEWMLRDVEDMTDEDREIIHSILRNRRR